MSVFSVIKDPDAVLDYAIDWDTNWLDGDTISASTWAITGPDSSLVVDSESETTAITTVWLSGGTLGRTYSVTNHIVTASGRADDRTITVTVTQK